MPVERSMYTLPEVAKMLSLSEHGLRRHAPKGLYGAVKVGGHWRWPKRIIDALVAGDELPRPKEAPAGTPVLDELEDEI